jgi:hypothetical protein
VCAALAACGPQGPEREGDPALDARIAVSPTPAQAGPARIRVRVTDGGEPLDDARVRLVALGPAGDSVGPVPAEPSPAGYGPVTMELRQPGRWRIEVRVTAPDGRSAVLRHPLQVVGGAGG